MQIKVLLSSTLVIFISISIPSITCLKTRTARSNGWTNDDFDNSVVGSGDGADIYDDTDYGPNDYGQNRQQNLGEGSGDSNDWSDDEDYNDNYGDADGNTFEGSGAGSNNGNNNNNQFGINNHISNNQELDEDEEIYDTYLDYGDQSQDNTLISEDIGKSVENKNRQDIEEDEEIYDSNSDYNNGEYIDHEYEDYDEDDNIYDDNSENKDELDTHVLVSETESELMEEKIKVEENETNKKEEIDMDIELISNEGDYNKEIIVEEDEVDFYEDEEIDPIAAPEFPTPDVKGVDQVNLSGDNNNNGNNSNENNTSWTRIFNINSEFWSEKYFLAALLCGATVGFIIITIIIVFICHSVRKSDEGSYVIDKTIRYNEEEFRVDQNHSLLQNAINSNNFNIRDGQAVVGQSEYFA